ncbi:MAG: hypothetical protein P1V20_27765 [Verrucomicrobiales bacterium]|nr:hypothetical protein [Verrucomicrobiales bacterium]
MSATLLDVKNQQAVLSLGTGQSYEIRISELSSADQKYIEDWLKQRPAMAGSTKKIILPSRIENPRPGDGKENTVFWTIDGDQGRGYLELTFPNDLFSSSLTDAPKVKKLFLVMKVATEGKAGSKGAIEVLNGRKRIASKVGAARGGTLRIEIPPLEYERSSKIKMTLRCGSDAVLFEKKDNSIFLEATFQ